MFGFGALFLSDVLFVRYLSEPLLSQIQALKGGIEVVLTAALLFVLTRRRERQLQRSMRRLNHQREELDVLHRVLRHNLRNDLCVVHGYAELVRDSLPSPSASLRSKCDVILDTAEEMTRYTEQASRINKLAHSDDRRTAYDLTEELPRLLDAHPLVTDDVEVAVTLPEEAVVEVAPLFEEALTEAIANAVEHNDADQPRIEIAVRTGSSPPHLTTIRIADNGPGIPATELDPLRTGEEKQLRHISGLGLWFLKWTIARSGGELAFEDNESGGTTVRVRVPNAPTGFVGSLLL